MYMQEKEIFQNIVSAIEAGEKKAKRLGEGK
ncbi:MAG: hypothetical protein Ct9H90mP4_10690 [Gammaproteobacteria bacterium]|nr:MAG: hypothetical protein Ct9H90mP4_10690 [Gammaproteobacteria bacterium]